MHAGLPGSGNPGLLSGMSASLGGSAMGSRDMSRASISQAPAQAQAQRRPPSSGEDDEDTGCGGGGRAERAVVSQQRPASLSSPLISSRKLLHVPPCLAQFAATARHLACPWTRGFFVSTREHTCATYALSAAGAGASQPATAATLRCLTLTQGPPRSPSCCSR